MCQHAKHGHKFLAVLICPSQANAVISRIRHPVDGGDGYSQKDCHHSADGPGQEANFVFDCRDDTLLALRTCHTSRSVSELWHAGDDHWKGGTLCKRHIWTRLIAALGERLTGLNNLVLLSRVHVDRLSPCW